MTMNTMTMITNTTAIITTGMTTAITTETTEASTRLQLMWLASPALPVGGFSYSEALEAAVEAGLVANEAQATSWLQDQLHFSLARADLPALARACAAWQTGNAAAAQHINHWLHQTRESAELRQQAEQMGRSLLDWLRNGQHAADPRIQALAALQPSPLWPTAFALAATLAGASTHDTLLAFAWGWAENMAQAAMKSVPLGQAAAQRMLGALSQDIPAVVQAAMDLPEDERQAFTPMLAILSAQHETQYSRLFRS
jgi:urease accessory protein